MAAATNEPMTARRALIARRGVAAARDEHERDGGIHSQAQSDEDARVADARDHSPGTNELSEGCAPDAGTS